MNASAGDRIERWLAAARMAPWRRVAPYDSYRVHCFAALSCWALLVGLAAAVAVIYLLPAAGYAFVIPLELSFQKSAALIANRVMRRRDEKRLCSGSILDREELLQERYDQALARLTRLGLPDESLHARKEELFALFCEHLFQIRSMQAELLGMDAILSAVGGADARCRRAGQG